MTWLIDGWLWTCAMALAIPVSTLAVECVMACWSRRPKENLSACRDRPPCVILIPAHDEADVIAETLQSLRPIIRADDQLIVIADNCTDDTALVATNLGFQVICRTDANRRGKGYAMQFGVDSLRPQPPSVVVFIDADCRLENDTLDLLVEQAMRTDRVAQANYRMRRVVAGENTKVSAKSVISEFAVLVKNWVRPRGLTALRLPTHLTGSGMAFPWSTASNVAFASDNIVEDMAIGCELMMQGRGPMFCEAAVVTAPLPTSDEASLEQRKRWEHGHLHTLLNQIPRMLWAAVHFRRPSLLGIACDLSIPPLTLLVMVLIGNLIASAIFFAIDPIPCCLLVAEILLMVIALTAAGKKFSDDSHLGAAVLAIPNYALTKVPLYVSYALLGRQRQWVRTARQPLHPTETPLS